MPDLTRRDVLRGSALLAAGALVTACTRGADAPSPTDPGGPEDPDRDLRAEIGRDERALVALYAEAAAVLRADARALAVGVGARHAAYRQAIDPDGLATQPATTTPSASATSGSATAAPTTPTYPKVTAATALTVLLQAETAAAAARVQQSVRAKDPELARVVSLAGAGCAAAAALLGRSA